MTATALHLSSLVSTPMHSQTPMGRSVLVALVALEGSKTSARRLGVVVARTHVVPLICLNLCSGAALVVNRVAQAKQVLSEATIFRRLSTSASWTHAREPRELSMSLRSSIAELALDLV